MPASGVAAFVFDPFRLNLDAEELWRDGERLEIRQKCFDLLLFLLENHGKLVTKDVLLERIWSNTLVSEGTLTRTVTELRKALQDDADNPRYIETVRRRGYKFIAPVEEVARVAAGVRPTTNFSLVHGAKEYPLHQGDQLIGRGREVAIPLYTSLTSRHHARIQVSGLAVTLEDLGSRNGTFVNGRKITGSVALKLGDQIQIGGELLVLWSPTGDTTPGTPSF